MEEVDKIIIQSLNSLGCDLSPDTRSIGQLDQDMFVDSVSKLLNAMSPGADLPSKLPPNTGVKFRICTKFANVCQQLGYKNEIGYQTFLYLNEADMRRLLMFLVEKLTKEVSSQADTQPGQPDKSKNLNSQIAQRFKTALTQFWMPDYCKLNSLRIQEDNTLAREGCKCLTDLTTVNLAIPYDYREARSREYLERHCEYVSDQATRQAVDLLSSLLQMNAVERLKEQALFRQDMNPIEEGKRLAIKESKVEGLRSTLRDSLKRASHTGGDELVYNGSALSVWDIAEIETDLEFSPKQLGGKASRFTHSERLQFTQEDENNVVVASSREEEKEEEINRVKQELDEVSLRCEELEQEIRRLGGSISRVEEECKDQEEANKKLQESIGVKEKIVKLIKDAPNNIVRLKEEIGNHEEKMASLEMQWASHKKPLERDREELLSELNERKTRMQERLEQTKSIRAEIEALNEELTSKDEVIVELNKDMESNAKASSRSTNRQFYTKRILEIMANIDKQKREINKVLIETRNIQKDINQLIGKLERVFNATDELIFKDAKKDETNKKVYKLFITINESYEQLVQNIEDSSHLDRDSKDLEDQVNSESQNKIADNMEMVLKDYKQIKEENETLVKNLKKLEFG